MFKNGPEYEERLVQPHSAHPDLRRVVVVVLSSPTYDTTPPPSDLGK